MESVCLCRGNQVNYSDVTGEARSRLEREGSGIPWISIATIGIFGGGLPPDYFINIQERDVWRRNSEQKVREWDLRIAAAAVAAARQRDEDGREFLYPHHFEGCWGLLRTTDIGW